MALTLSKFRQEAEGLGAGDLTSIRSLFLKAANLDYGLITDEHEISLFCRLAIFLRDLGDVATALDGLSTYYRSFKSSRIKLELLIIISYVLSDIHKTRLFIKQNDLLETDTSDVRLMHAYGLALIGEIEPSLEAFQTVDRFEVCPNPFFNQIYSELQVKYLHQVEFIVSKIPAIVGKDRILASLFQSSILARLSFLRGDDFESFIRKIIFTGSDQERIASHLFMENLREIKNTTDPINLTVLLRLLISIKETSEATKLALELSHSSVRANPDFLKSLFKLSDETNDGKWALMAREICSGAPPVIGNEYLLNRSKVQAYELFKRLETPSVSSVSALQPVQDKHIFIGIFGQLRYERENLGNLISRITGILDRCAPGLTVSFGVSTWDTTGRRDLLGHTPVGFLLEVVPIELVPLIRELGVPSVSDAQNVLPAVISKIILEQGSVSKVNSDYIKDIAGFRLPCDIASADAFNMGEEINIISEKYFGDVDIMNQARMFNRLQGLKPLVETAEKWKGRPVTHGLLVRNDLNFKSDSLGLRIQAFLNSNVPNSFASDDDPHANFIEGVGDRYMLCDNLALAHIIEANHIFRSLLLETGEFDQSVSYRFLPHQMLESVLFQRGTSISRIGVSEVPFEIYRGRRNISDFVRELEQDSLRHSGDYVGEQLARILATL